MTGSQDTHSISRDPRVWTTLSSRELLARPPRLRVLTEKVRLPDGRIVDDFYQIELPEYVVVFAQTSEGSIVMERLYKHGVRRVILTLPAGHIEPGEELLEGAKREFLEETGYEAGNWHSLGCFVVNGNQGCGKAHLFMADGACQTKHPNSDDLEETEVVLMTRGEVIHAISSGEIATLSTVAALALALSTELVKR